MTHYIPNSRLLGIQLTISTHSGPQVVYHYPPCAADRIQAKKAYIKKYDHTKTANILHTPTDLAGRSMDIPATLQRSKDDSSINISIPSPRTANLLYESFPDNNDNVSITSDSESSGLSDSELSTDYSDVSSLSSESFSVKSNSFSISKGEAETTNEFSNTENSGFGPQLVSSVSESKISNPETKSNLSSRNKSSLISASKLLDIFNNEISNSNSGRRSSLTSRLSSLHTVQDNTSSFQTEIDDDSASDIELSNTLEQNLISFNQDYFDQECFQEINKIFGFDSEFVAEICSPEREMCNNNFEFTVDKLCFLGLPIHIDSEGNWKKSKKKKHSGSRRSVSVRSKGSRRRSSASNTTALEHGSEREDDENLDEILSLDDIEVSHSNPIAIHDSNSSDIERHLNMFHVCFIMNPPLSEYNQRVDDMFHYIVARLSLALRSAQAKSNYVSKECDLILKEKEHVLKASKKYKKIKGSGNRGRYLYQRLLTVSSLARALTTCVDNLQRNEISSLEIGDDKILTLHIPIHDEFWKLPQSKLEPVLRGSYLTSIVNSKFLGSSANKRAENEKHHDTYLNEEEANATILQYSLLLLDEPANIIEKLESFTHTDNVGNVVLRRLVKHIQPNVPISFYQPLVDDLLGDMYKEDHLFQVNILKYCTLHLIYWRHARVIIPISSKNLYIVSPLAPIQGSSKDDITDNYDLFIGERKSLIYQNQDIFKKAFPSLPPLPSFLSLLSNGKPRAFGTIIPSKEHKPIYLGALAWLIRFGYITQLLTFVCIRVDKQIKMAVDEDLEKDGFRNKRQPTTRTEVKLDNVVGSKTGNSLDADKKGEQPNSNAKNESISNKDDEELTHFQYDDPEMEKDYTIILEPERAGAIEKRWIYKCIHEQPPDIQILFNRMLKYFNGRVPIEVAILKEGVSRHELRKLLHVMNKYLIEIYHW